MKALFDKFGRKHVARLVLCVLAFLLIAEVIIVYFEYTAIRYNGAMLRLDNLSVADLTMKDAAGNALTAEFKPPEHAPHVTDFGYYCTIKYLGKRIEHSLDLTRERANSYTFSDGSTLDFSSIVEVVNGEPNYGTDLTPLQASEIALIERICDYYFSPKSAGDFALIALAGMILLLLGVRSFFFPENVWRWRYMFSVSGGEPTELYIIVTKGLGVLWVVFAFAIVLIV